MTSTAINYGVETPRLYVVESVDDHGAAYADRDLHALVLQIHSGYLDETEAIATLQYAVMLQAVREIRIVAAHLQAPVVSRWRTLARRQEVWGLLERLGVSLKVVVLSGDNEWQYEWCPTLRDFRGVTSRRTMN